MITIRQPPAAPVLETTASTDNAPPSPPREASPSTVAHTPPPPQVIVRSLTVGYAAERSGQVVPSNPPPAASTPPLKNPNTTRRPLPSSHHLTCDVQIRPGDEIVEIDGHEVQCDTSRAKVLILGKQGSFATVVICRIDGDNLRYS